MTAHTILFLGNNESMSEYIDALEKSAICDHLIRAESIRMPSAQADNIDLILFEVGPQIVQSGQTLQSLIDDLSDYPTVAVTTRETEHRGIAAVRAGAQAYVCIDETSHNGIDILRGGR